MIAFYPLADETVSVEGRYLGLSRKDGYLLGDRRFSVMMRSVWCSA
jgi:hypothetical protein